ncbi:hypothetical protein RGC27_03105 [Helicobacter pylori]|nr:hypothetical protein [Helicobacter pylori]MDU9792883.1 hypothetical protein [Helicobacter pylori]
MNAKNTVKERPEEARNSLKGNFYLASPLGGALESFGSLLFSAFLFSLCFIIVLLKFQNDV